MIRAALLLALASLPAAAQAQITPVPDAANPRLQTAVWQDGAEIVLTALPQTGLTVMLEPGEQILEVVPGQADVAAITVSAERDSFVIVPAPDMGDLSLRVRSDKRTYPLRIRTESSLLAAYLVRFLYPAAAGDYSTGQVWSYRLKGDKSVRPSAISDDGVRTSIAFAPDQALPAVFALNARGDEEVVNGYMRGDHFVIDRVYPELVFRIDKAKASARRAGPGGAGK